jgi:hypothetical protein
MKLGDVAVSGAVAIEVYFTALSPLAQSSYQFVITHTGVDKKCNVVINTPYPWEELNDGERDIYLRELAARAILGLKQLIPVQDRWWENDSTI